MSKSIRTWPIPIVTASTMPTTPSPLDDMEDADIDGDGIGDNADSDDDNDGIIDAEPPIEVDVGFEPPGIVFE
tara:strand:- start:134 stop:352 length:219 start_codon:yes stop_codon:yes gene_type:complete